jgi:hypothetical protein
MASKRPPLTVEQILAWADEPHARTGQWPRERSGPVAAAPGEKWCNIGVALAEGFRGLPGGDSLARLLARERGAINPKGRPHLSHGKIRTWAAAHRRRRALRQQAMASSDWPLASSAWPRLLWAWAYFGSSSMALR